MQAETNYIYILFAVLYVIYSIIKAGKKITKNPPASTANPDSDTKPSYTSQKKDELKPIQPPTATPTPHHSPGEDLKKMLEDLWGGNSETQIPEVQIPRSNQQQPSEKTPYHQHKTGSQHIEHPKNTPHSLEKEKLKSVQDKHLPSMPKTTSKKVFTESVVEDNLEADFDIRQAIIYSEILKRPEY